jgi:hypothetical protein
MIRADALTLARQIRTGDISPGRGGRCRARALRRPISGVEYLRDGGGGSHQWPLDTSESSGTLLLQVAEAGEVILSTSSKRAI